MSRQGWHLVIHGGAGAMRPKRGDPDHEQRAREGLRAALDAGAAILAAGGAALDAVEASVRLLEDDACFNAGRGLVEQAARAMLADLDEWRLVNQQRDLSI